MAYSITLAVICQLANSFDPNKIFYLSVHNAYIMVYFVWIRMNALSRGIYEWSGKDWPIYTCGEYA